jgi:hypothetical protein
MDIVREAACMAYNARISPDASNKQMNPVNSDGHDDNAGDVSISGNDGQQLNLPLVSPERLPARAATHRVRQAEAALRAARTRREQHIQQAMRRAVQSARIAALRRAGQS